MASKSWPITLDGREHRIDLDHRYWLGTTVLRVDGAVALRAVPGFAGIADHWFGPSEFTTQFGSHELRARITPNLSYGLDLMVDGRSASTNELVPALPQAPNDAFFRLGKFGASVGMIAIPYLIVVTFVFGRFAPQWGPRWFAANDLMLNTGVLPLLLGVGLYFVNVVRKPSPISTRLFYGIFGVASLWVAATSSLALPTQLADVVGALEMRTVVVLDSSERGSNPPTIRVVDGSTYVWMSAFGQYAYPSAAPGTYEVTLTTASHRVLAIRALR